MISEKDFKPVSDFALQLGCKIVLYGLAGSGKTPLAALTSPRPLILLTEPGALTLRGCNVPAFAAMNPKAIDEFFDWLKGSKEASNYDTIIVDSATQMAEVYLNAELKKTTSGGNAAHGLKAHGDMATKTMEHLSTLFFMPKKHVILIAKRVVDEDMGVQMAKPWFPGQKLNVQVPHLFDGIFQLGRFPNVNPNAPMLQCTESFDAIARDRSGRLAQYEPPHFGNLFAKMMS